VPASIVLERLLWPAGAATPAQFARRRVYIFMTGQGLLFGFTLAVMLLGAVNYTNSMAYILTFLLCSLFMVCMLHTYRNLRGLVIRLADAEPVFAGDSARFPLLLDNRAAGPRLALSVGVHPPRRRRREASAPAIGFDLAADELKREIFPVPARQRGIHRLERLLIESTWPLGIFRAWSYLDTAPEVIVYPRPAGDLPLPESDEASTEEHVGGRPGADDFTGFRAYRPGDSARSIDWKAFAREQGLLVKRFAGAGSRWITLSWDATPAHDGVEARLAQLCRWVLDAERQGMSYALRIPGVSFDHDSGEAQRRRCLEALARFGEPDGAPAGGGARVTG
jgi:uncharacterized protein (DUF58 family)